MINYKIGTTTPLTLQPRPFNLFPTLSQYLSLIDICILFISQIYLSLKFKSRIKMFYISSPPATLTLAYVKVTWNINKYIWKNPYLWDNKFTVLLEAKFSFLICRQFLLSVSGSKENKILTLNASTLYGHFCPTLESEPLPRGPKIKNTDVWE